MSAETELRNELIRHGLDTKGPESVLKQRLQQYYKLHPELKPVESSGKKRRKKAKKTTTSTISESEFDVAASPNGQVEIEVEPMAIDLKQFPEFERVFEEFNKKGIEKQQELVQNDIESDEEEDDDEDMEKMTRSQKKKARISVAELKTKVKNPDLVEWVDVTAKDPLLLIALKATRNTIPVPDHWQMKRAYLQGKRGMVKPPFELPEYIKATGIMQTRQSTAKSMVGKIRERYHPKLGRMDLDYQKLHDAFFKYQTKPVFSNHGDLYHEGKEFETRLRTKRPGAIGEELALALNIPEGAPPPWLISMQRYGPPPSYPQLKIPGLNAPIPPGAQWGFHPGGWGKPPTDQNNRPLYGDVFGTMIVKVDKRYIVEPELEKWGEIIQESEEESAAEEVGEEQSDEEMEEDEDTSGLESPVIPIQGLETPAEIDLVKKVEPVKPQQKEKKELYTILQQSNQKAGSFMMSDHKYDVKGVELSIDPDNIDGMEMKDLEKQYKQASTKNTVLDVKKSDLGDMVEEFERGRQQPKRGHGDDGRKSTKKHQKDFKF